MGVAVVVGMLVAAVGVGMGVAVVAGCEAANSDRQNQGNGYHY